MIFNGYSFYFVFFAFVIYALSYLIWKFKSTKQKIKTFSTSFILKKTASKILCSCIGFGIILLPLILSFVASPSKTLHHNLETIKQHSHLYPICSSDFGALTVSDLSYLSALSYHVSTKEAVVAGLDTYFEADGNDLVYVAGQLDKEPIFYHVTDRVTQSHYIVIR